MSKGIRATIAGRQAARAEARRHAEGLLGGSPTPKTRRGDEVPEKVAEAARAVRHVLLHDFPDRRKLESQCKRAGVMLRAILQKDKLEVRLISGRVLGDRRSPTAGIDHVWCRVRNPRNGLWYLLDVALAQFDYLFDRPIPIVVWGEYRSTLRKYGYLEDSQAEWAYDPREFDPRRLDAARSLLG